MDYGRFQTYTPSFDDAHPLKAIETRARFFRNDAGQDFYELRLTLPTDCTWLAVDDTGVIQMASNDVQGVVPEDRRLVSIPQVADPSGLVGKLFGADGTISDPPAPTKPVVDRAAFEAVGAALGMTAEQIEAMVQAAEAR